MDVCVILTYRCNARCAMCNAWQHPTLPSEEVSLETLSRLPSGIDYLNLTGGEPTLRRDLLQIVELLHPKAMQLEISSNGLLPERLEPIIARYPDIKVRFSLDGLEETTNRIRGEVDGFRRKVQGLRRLRELGGQDLGLAVTIQDDNVDELAALFELAQREGFELATSALHNGFQFHKGDNVPHDRLRVAHGMEELIAAMLRSNQVKNWFRAYLNLGLMAKVLGQPRLLPCAAGSDFLFVDPWGDVFACNVRNELKMGSLQEQSWQAIINGPTATAIRQQVRNCAQNCWMVGSAKTAMRSRLSARLPKLGPLWWVASNKLRVTLGHGVRFERVIDYGQVHQDLARPPRPSHLGTDTRPQKREPGAAHYAQEGGYDNV